MYEPSFKISVEVCIEKQLILVSEESIRSLLDKDLGYHFDYYRNPKASYPAPCLTNGALPYRFTAFSNETKKGE